MVEQNFNLWLNLTRFTTSLYKTFTFVESPCWRWPLVWL